MFGYVFAGNAAVRFRSTIAITISRCPSVLLVFTVLVLHIKVVRFTSLIRSTAVAEGAAMVLFSFRIFFLSRYFFFLVAFWITLLLLLLMMMMIFGVRSFALLSLARQTDLCYEFAQIDFCL